MSARLHNFFPKIQHLGLDVPHWGKLGAKLKFLGPTILPVCRRKITAVGQSLEEERLPLPSLLPPAPTCLTHGAAAASVE